MRIIFFFFKLIFVFAFVLALEPVLIHCLIFGFSDEYEMVLPSDNSVAAVGYLNFKEFHLENKDVSFNSYSLDPDKD